MNKKVFILGGGVSGLAAATKLLDTKKCDVTLLEKADHLGGLAASFEMEGEQIPKFYHHIVRSNKTTIKYLTQFGAMQNAKWKRVKIAILKDGKTYELTKPWEFLSIKGVSLYAKIRFALFGLYVIFKKKCPTIPADMNAQEWLYRYCGKEATDFFWWNLYGRNKFNIPLSKIAAAQFAQRLWEKEGYDLFTFPPKGLDVMIGGFADEIKKKSGKIITNADITHLDVKKKEIIVNGKKEKYDILINTIPVPEFMKFAKGLSASYVKKIEKLKYCPGVGLCFATEEFLLPKVYWLNIFGERIHVLMQHSVLVDKYNHKVSWCIRYGGSEEDLALSNEEIIKEYTSVIKKYFPTVKFKWIKVFKEKYAEPVYDKDYVTYAPDYKTPVQGLYNAGIQVTFPKIRNQNVALESGEKVAELVKEDYL